MRRCAPVASAPRASFATRSARCVAPAPRAAPVKAAANLSRGISCAPLRQTSPYFVPRRSFAQAVTEPDFRDYKRTTGLVGIPALPPKEARQILMMVCEKVLKELEHGIPENASYRTGTAAIFKERLKIAQENLDPRDIERLIDCGQIEELIIQGEKELSLIPDMRENKPWDVPPDHKINIIIREKPVELKDKTGALLNKPAAAPAK